MLHIQYVLILSAGGIIALATIHKGLSVSNCLELFQRLSEKAFTRRFACSGTLFSKTWDSIVSCILDCVYPSRNINQTLQDQFGDKDTLGDYSAATARGAKVVVTATGIPSGEYIMTNYNGVGVRRKGYRVALYDNGSGAISTWEA